MTGIIRRVSAILFAAIFTLSMPLAAYAVEANVSYGDVSVGDTQVTHTPEAGGSATTEDHGGSVTVTGSSTENNITVDVSAGNTVEVTLQDVSIDTSSSADNSHKGEAAMEISGAGNVVVELDGENSLTSGNWRAGLETSQEGGSLTIQDENDREGSLTAQGGTSGAGIGGGGPDLISPEAGNGSNITITGGEVTATGGTGAAGIGGGSNTPGYEGGSGSDITISGGKVTATSNGAGGAGIGGGANGSGDDITISGGEVTATGSKEGAGIGGGNNGSGSDITISGGKVTATSSVNASGNGGGAGIGGGGGGTGSGIEISGGEVTATGGNKGAGIGGGKNGSGDDIAISGGKVTATSSVNTSGEGSGAGIGGGSNSTGSDISISGDAQVSASGSGTAADVGGGAQTTDTEKQENNVDTSGLYTTGSFTGSTGEVVKGEVEPPAPEAPAEPSAPSVSTDSYYYVQATAEPYTVSEDYTKTEKDGVLTITVKGEEAELEITASGIRELIADGIHTLVFVTDKAETQVVLDELVKDCADTDEFVITHKGDVAALTLNGEEIK